MEWIDASERVPESDLTVLVATDDFQVAAGFHDGDDWRFEQDAGKPIVTHWMDLPVHPLETCCP